jgi:hypothetical protein
LPDTLNVSYVVRKPYAYVDGGDTIKIVDNFGEVLEVVTYKTEDMPSIYGIDITKYEEGEILTGVDLVKYRNSIYLLETAESVGFNYQITDINYKDTENVIFRVKDLPIRVLYGEVQKNIMSDKLIYLNEILKKTVDRGYKGTLDFSVEDYMNKSVLNSEI